MNCPACGHENRAGAKFCEECAAPLKRACASCGAELRPTAKFCDECATPTSASPASQARAAEGASARKVVTIVFADLVGSTALHERVDAESARRLMERYYETLRVAVEGQGGTVVKLLGDGVMAAFGVPQVAEDDATRAVRAGVAMQEAFRALADKQAAVLAEVGLRVAVNTGEVIVSGANDDVVGDPVNVAARLQEEAGDGDVVIGEATHRLVASLVTLEPLGSFALKGRSGAVTAYRVVSLERPAGASATPFMGRDSELARIMAVYEAATTAPAARLAVVLGSPGLGKSRLIDELGLRLGDRASVITAHCDPAGGVTFAPLADALREFLGVDDGADGDALRGAIESSLLANDPERARIATGVASLLAGAPASPEETFFVVRRLLAALATHKPVVLVIDDLQWAEPLLLDLVEHLVQWGGDVPLLVLVGARLELRDTRSSMVMPGGLVTDVLTLGGLDAGAATRLAAHVVGASDLPAAVAAKVLATSEGNPLFVGELVRMLVHEGVLTRDGDRWIVGEGLASFEMPPTIHALLAARIERLRPEDRIILERAAVIGRQFSRSAVAELLPGDADELDARLEALRRGELIESDAGWFLGEPVLRFHHVLIRDAAYRRLLKETRAELHARFADWIEARAGDSVEHDEMIGRHLEQAHQLLGELGAIDDTGRALGERAANRLAAAGRRALARDDVSLAANLLGRALRCLDSADPARPDLALDACEALLASGDVGPAAAVIEEIGGLAVGSERLQAWHTCFVGQLTTLTAPEALQATAHAVATAAEQLASLDDTAGEAKAHFVHAQTLARLGKVGAAEAALDRALAAARRAGDRRRANAVLAGAPLAALWGPSPVTRASGRCLDVVRVLRITQGAPAVEAIALSCQGVLEALRGRTDAARRMIASSRRMVEELGISHRLFEADVFAARIDLLEGDPIAAERVSRVAYEGLRDLGLGIDAARAAALLARALLAQGRAGEAEALSHESEALAGDDLQAAIAWRGVRAEALAQRGETDAALELAQAAVAIAAATDALLDHADARLALAAALRAAGRVGEADAEERRALDLWETKGATLLANRARSGAAPVAAEPSAHEKDVVSAGAPRRRLRPNAALAAMARIDAAFAARDADGMRTLFAEHFEEIDHPTGSSFGLDGVHDSVTRFLRSHDASLRHEPLATLGERLGLCRRSVRATGTGVGNFDVGEYEVEVVSVWEVDERGLLVHLEVFAADHLADAMACLYERYAEQLPIGAERDGTIVKARSIGSLGAMPNLDRMAAAVTPDVQAIDHRNVGYGSVQGVESWRAALQALFELADDLVYRLDDVLGLCAEAFLIRATNRGTSRLGGGPFERSLWALAVFAADGRVARWEQFDVAQESEALARFDALTAEPEASWQELLTVRPNGATAALTRLDAAMATRDDAALDVLFGDDLEVVDHPNGAEYGRDAVLASTRRFLQMREPRGRHEQLATLGESLCLCLCRLTASGTDGSRFDVGAYEQEAVRIYEVDEQGTIRRCEFFAADRLGVALARMYERHAELLRHGPLRERAAVVARSVAMLGETSHVARYAASVGPDLAAAVRPDIEVVDHRRVGFGALKGVESAARAYEAMFELADDMAWRLDGVLAASPDALLVRGTNSGTERLGGGAFERVVWVLQVFGNDGRIARWEQFDVGQESMALARFDELTEGATACAASVPPVRRRVQPNAASAVTERVEAAFRARDLDAVDALLGEHLENIDRPTGATYGREAQLDSSRRMMRLPDLDLRNEMLATLDESLCLCRRLVTASGTAGGNFDVAEYEMEHITLVELDDVGRIGRFEVFAPDHLGDAIVRLYERYAEQLADESERERAASTARAVRAQRDPFVPEGLASIFTPDVEMTDKRVLGTWNASGVDAVLEQYHSLQEVDDDVVLRDEEVLALRPEALLVRRMHSGSERLGGGAYERPFLMLIGFGRDGRLARQEWFDVGREADALARFDELTAVGTTLPATRFANTATRVWSDLTALLSADQSEDYAQRFPMGFRFSDRRRHVQLELDRDQFLEHYGHLADASPSRVSRKAEILATRGDRLFLARLFHEFSEGDVGPSLLEHLNVAEVDEHGDPVAVVRFDADDLDSAYAELDARWEAGEAVAHPSVLAWVVEFRRAFESRDWDAMVVLDAPDQIAHNHRLVGWGTLRGAGAWVPALQELVAFAPDVRLRADHVRTSECGLLLYFSWHGTRDGGAFETPIVTVAELNESGRQQYFDVWDADMLDAAFARFDELSATAVDDPLAAIAKPNVATVAMDRWRAAYEAQDWGTVRALCAPSMIFEDRQRLALVSGDRELMSASARERAAIGARNELRLVGTAGDRIAISRSLWSGGPADGRFEMEYYVMFEVDESGLITAIILFDLDDAHSAQHAAWARWSAIDPVATQWVELVSASADSFNDRDLAMSSAIFAEDIIVDDHRWTGFGRLEGRDAYLDAVAVLWELAPDTRIEFGWHWPAYNRHAAVTTVRRSGTVPDGGPFESDYLILYVVAGGLVERMEFFEIDALDAALARFEELGEE